MTDRTDSASDACHVRPPRLCMGCNADLTGTYATRLFCDPCRSKRVKRMRAERDRAAHVRRWGSSEPRRKGPQRDCPHCAVCFGMPHRRPETGCLKCGLPWAPEMNVRQAPTSGAWVWL